MPSKTIATCIILSLGLLSTLASAADPILYYSFDELGSVVADQSGNGRDGTPHGGLTLIDAGRFGKCFEFNGVDAYVELPRPIDKDFTLMAWMKADKAGAAGTQAYQGNALFWSDVAGTANDFVVAVLGTKLSFFVGNPDTSVNSKNDIVTSEWMHIAAVRATATGTMSIYIDGKLDSSIKHGNTGPLDAQALMAVGANTLDGRYFAGQMDEVKVYNVALTAAEIRAMVPYKVKARKPSPANGATGVTVPLLSWTPGETITYDEIYVGSTPELTAANLVRRQSSMAKMIYYTALVPGQTYYWRVDSIDAKGVLVATGDVWSFTMAPVNAFSPAPVNGAAYQDPNVDLSWSAGQYAYTHEVYFSENKDDVANGAAAALKASVAEPKLTLPLLPLGTTYYWRVDEIETTGTRRVGDVWSFTTTLPGLGAAKRELWLNGAATAAISDLTNDARYPGSPTDVNEMPSFESPADLGDHYGGRLSAWLYVPLAGEYTFWLASDDNGQLFLGADPDSAEMIASVTPYTAAQAWDSYSSQQSKPVMLEAGRYYLMALWKENEGGDHCAVAWQGGGISTRDLIRGNYLMPFEALWAYGPRPRNDSNEVTQTPVLTWIAGTKAATHQVYFGVDEQAVAQATPDSPVYQGEKALDDTRFDPGALEFGKTYYWRVDEINPAEADSPWKGAAWSFTTADFVVIDSFEDYVDDTEGRIFQTWIDGWGYTEPAPGNPGNGTGSTVGYTTSPFAEQSIVHGGRQAMPFDYNNIIQPYYSETDRTWATAGNWTLNGVTTLSLWFRGYPVKFVDDGATITLSAAGDDIWNSADAFRFACKKLSGDGSITAKVNSLVQTDVWAKAGVMIRESLTPGSANAANIVSASSGVSFQYRLFTDDTCSNVGQTGLKAPYWVRLTRTGNTFKAEVSADGKTWSSIGTDAAASSKDVTLTGSIYIGLCVTSHNADRKIATTAVFSDIKTTGGVSGQWQVADIGMTHPGNDAAQLYVAVQDSAGKTAVVKHPDLNAVLATEWTQWQIPLTQFTGVNTKAVKKMFIGVGDRVTPQAGGSGKLFIDDIRVIKP